MIWTLSLLQLQVTRKSSGSHFQFKETGSPPSLRFFYPLSILPVGTAFLVLQVTRSLVRRSPLSRTFVSPSSPTAALTAPPHPGVLRLHLWGIPPDRPPPDVFLSHLFSFISLFTQAGRAESEELISSRCVCVCLRPKMSNHRLPLDSWQQRENKTTAAFIAEKHKTDAFA